MSGPATVEDEMSGAPELVANLHRVALRLAADLDVVLAFEPREAIVDLDPVADEGGFEIVTDVEEAAGIDLRNRRQVWIDGQPHAQLLHARHVVGRRES